MNNETQARWSKLCDRWSREGYSSLSAEEQLWLNVRSLIDSVENGGLISYFYNSGADTVQDCLRGLELLGGADVKEQVERVCALFPGGVPCGIDARNEVIDSWGDEGAGASIDHILAEVDEALMPLLEGLEVRLNEYLHRTGLAT